VSSHFFGFPNCNTNNYVVQFDDLSGCPAGHRRLSFSKRSLPQWPGLMRRQRRDATHKPLPCHSMQVKRCKPKPRTIEFKTTKPDVVKHDRRGPDLDDMLIRSIGALIMMYADTRVEVTGEEPLKAEADLYRILAANCKAKADGEQRGLFVYRVNSIGAAGLALAVSRRRAARTRRPLSIVR
jgi:hypothetical protein